jgi:MFS family permease
MAQTVAFESASAGARSGLWRMVALLCLVYIVAILDRFVMVMLVPGIKATFAISDTQISLLNGGAFALCNAGAVLVCGRLADTYNRRNLLMTGLVAWSLATIACGLAQTFSQLLGARIGLGVFQAILGPAALSMTADRAPPELRGRAIALVVAGGTIGGAVANFVGGGLLQLFTTQGPEAMPFGGVLEPWQLVLVVCGLPGLLLAPLLLTVADPPRHPMPAGVRFRVMPHLIENRGVFLPLFAACALFLMASYAQASWVAVVLLRNLQMPPGEVGLVLGLITLAAAGLAAVLGGNLSDWFVRRDPNGGRFQLLILLLPLMAAGSVPLIALQYPVLVVGSFASTALLGTMISASVVTILPELTPSEGRGQVLGVFGLVGIICGMGVGPTLVALVTDHVLHDEGRLPVSVVLVATPAFVVAAVLAGLAIPAARRLRDRLRALTAEA